MNGKSDFRKFLAPYRSAPVQMAQAAAQSAATWYVHLDYICDL